jgi:ATP-binding cassette subfamily B protein
LLNRLGEKSDHTENMFSRFLSAFRFSGTAMRLVWESSPKLTTAMALTTLISGLIPAAIAFVGGLFVDVVAEALSGSGESSALFAARNEAVFYLSLEAGLVLLLAGAQQIGTVSQSILRVLLGNKINVLILEKALTLELAHFEDAEYYDKLVRARREASSRPLSLVMKTFDLIRNGISLIAIGVWLFQFSVYAVLLLLVAGVPAFVAEAKFAGEAFRVNKKRSAERRRQIYLEMVLTREDGVKEVKLLQLGNLFLRRYVAIFHKIFSEDKDLVVRRGLWGFCLGAVSSFAFYFAYGWVGFSAIAGFISIGQMTMYIAQFRIGQNGVTSSLTSINGMYEDNLYLSNLIEYLDHEVPVPRGDRIAGSNPEDGIRFKNVTFYYPGSTTPALKNINLHIVPGTSLAIVGENGSGKTTLIKLLTRLYLPTEGIITIDGLDVRDWDIGALREKIGVIFQDFARYQLLISENIGIGDVDNLENKNEIKTAARKGMADAFVNDLPKGYETQLGTWFKEGKELSGGQWQKIALSRAFMRSNADILILDEPTAAIDAKAEADIFEHFAELTESKISIIISHRFSTVRRADHIIVLEKAGILERGSHSDLLDLDGHYADLFKLQALGYQ